MPLHTVTDAAPSPNDGPVTVGGHGVHGAWSLAWNAPLWAHAAVLAIVLLIGLPVLGGSGLFSADEGALAAQARQLHDQGTWVVANSFPEVDPEGRAFPYDLSQPTDDGAAPFVKHTVYPLLASPLLGVGGVGALRLLSIAGTVVAASAAAALARSVRPSLSRPSLWAVGLGTPLLFDSFLLIAHTLGAACATLALVAGLRAVEHRRSTWAAAVGALVLAAGLLRNEAILYGLAMALAFGVVAARRRDGRTLVVAAAAAVGAVSAKVADGLLTQAVVEGARPIGVPAGSGSGPAGLLSGRVDALVTTLVAPGYGGRPLASLLVLLVAGLLVAAALAARRRDVDGGLVTVLVSGAAAGAVLRVAVGPHGLVPGLLVACPILLTGLCLLHRDQLRGPAGLIAGTSGAFVVAVAATQYATGGSGEWGGRYFAVGVPAMVPLALAALAAAGARLRPVDARRVAIGLGVVALCFSVLAVSSLRAILRGTADIVDQVAAVAADTDAGDGGAPVVLTTAAGLPRLAWERVPDGRWLLVDEEQVGEYAERLRAAGVERLVYVGEEPDRTDAVVDGSYRVAVTLEPVAGARWTAQVLEAS